MAKKSRYLRARDEVVVRTPEEIISTLDDDGALDGVPFMPEMVSSCGESFRVARRVEKTCVEVGGYQMRRFPANDVVLLDRQRCSGDGHDGCTRGCMIFWKEAWLRRVSPGEPAVKIDESQRARLRQHLTVKTDPTHYTCQSTRLKAATVPFPGKQTPWMMRVALREIWVGNRSVLEVIGLLAHWIKYRLRTRILGKRELRGPNKKTPTESLGLTPGEWVEIKSLPKILETLDSKQRNRGLIIAHAMTQNCGKRFEVERRVERMISEKTGEMREVRNTVALTGLECHCYYQCMGCPRGDLQYWREIWLERLQDAPAGATPSNTAG